MTPRSPSPRPLTDRMAATIADLERRWNGKRRPKAFYLVEEDWRTFMATSPPTIETMFGNNPPRKVSDPAFEGLPVRLSSGTQSRLYDSTAQGKALLP